jgi:HEAT repeat protein
LGRLGLVAATRWLLRALSDEAHDHEGRPGAGLGIQYPVRADILWALGEIADPAAVPVLVGYLGDVQGSALGGFRLPAMEALRKVGPPAIPALQRAAAGPEVVAAHAVAVLRALNADTARWRTDPRSSVARAAG